MSKHSKNNTSGMVFTYHERKQLKYGTVTERIGRDSIKDFDCCSLCIHPAIDPMCCNKGHLFCKECIYGYMLNQKKENARMLEKWEEQERKLQEEREQKELEDREREIHEFDKSVHGLLPVTNASSTQIIQHQDKTNNNNNNVTRKEDPRKGLKLNSFWVPSLTPEAQPSVLKKPSTEIKCPEGDHVLRLKQLTAIMYSENKDKEAAQEGKYRCGSCFKTLSNAVRTVCLKKCGHIICAGCYDRVKSDKVKQCPQCSKPFKEKHVIKMETGGTGFAGSAGEKLNATKVTPTAWL
mmetsp:Transcript_26865/g.37842  ORF Transcript_26865/g.37842 Transcript_26865/m.37842 type:complete len:294 (-) Transcript_26865:1291-2172(-)